MTDLRYPANDIPVLDDARLEGMITAALTHAQEKPSNVIQFFKRPAVWGGGVAALAACLALLMLPINTKTPAEFHEPDIGNIIMFDILADLT